MPIATVTPFYRLELSAEEAISLSHLRRVLGAHENIAILPEGLQLPLEGFRIERFPAHWFVSVASYNRLLLTEGFYERFAQYDFILIYQLDCLVFRDELQHWTTQPWDYIGAPWLKDFTTKARQGAKLWQVGNGGFSLRRVSSFLRVLREFDRGEALRLYWSLMKQRFPGPQRWWRFPKLMARALPIRRPLNHYLDGNLVAEDLFWGFSASQLRPDFSVAPPEVALSFAFETDPAFCYECNKQVLPFGAHAWQRYDRKFWEAHLLPEVGGDDGR